MGMSNRQKNINDAHSISDKLQTLDDRECSILRMSYGLWNDPRKTSNEISLDLGISKYDVHRIRNKAINKVLNYRQE